MTVFMISLDCLRAIDVSHKKYIENYHHLFWNEKESFKTLKLPPNIASGKIQHSTRENSRKLFWNPMRIF